MTHKQLSSLKPFLTGRVVFLAKKATRLWAIVLTLLSMCAVLGSAALMQGTSVAFALQTKLPTNESFYMDYTGTGTSSDAYKIGCDQGQMDASTGDSSLVILDFGGQLSDGSGTLMINGGTATNSQIRAVAETVSEGYYVCTGADTTTTMYLAIGTNNSNGDVSSSGGNTWFTNVNDIQNSNISKGYYPQVKMRGANDIETWCGTSVGCQPVSAALNWVNGYKAALGTAGLTFYDYGSADGCPQTTSNNGTCENGWTQKNYWYMSYGSGAAYPTPQIYYNSQAEEWAMISLYGAQQQGKPLNIAGPLDEYPLNSATNTATQAWDDLWNAVNANSSTAQNFRYSLEIDDESNL